MRLPTRAVACTLAAGFLAAVAFPASPAQAAQQRTWNFEQARTVAAQAAGRYGEGVTVAVVDTWIDVKHPDFGGRILPGVDCVGGCGRHRYRDDGCEHGTHVAGTIGSASYGVAPKARILPLRVLAWDRSEKDCTGTSTDVAAAIRYAVGHGARVVNLSLGAQVALASGDEAMARAVAEAAAAGVVVVFAAGNSTLPVADTFGPSALLVAATDRYGDIASYSQHGAGVDVAAPGGDAPGGNCTVDDCVISTWPGSPDDPDQYAALAGTSMAAPHVAGLAALLLAQDPTRDRTAVVERILGNARPLDGAGAGLVDMAAALGAPVGPPPSAPARPAKREVRPAQAPAGTRPSPRRVPAAAGRSADDRLPGGEVGTAVDVPARAGAAGPRTGSQARLVPAFVAALLAAAVGAGVVRICWTSPGLNRTS